MDDCPEPTINETTLSPKISECNFAVDAVLVDEGVQVDQKAEGRKIEFESFFNTMYPVCSKYAQYIVRKQQGKIRTDADDQDNLIAISQYTTTYMNMALQIWVGKFMRNQ